MPKTLASRSTRSTRPPEFEVDLDASTAALIAILANRLTRNVSFYCRKHYKIGSIELRILMQLRRQQNVSSRQIAAFTDLDKAAVSRSLMTLQKRGMIEQKPMLSHNRGRPLVLTPKGEQVAAELFEATGRRHEHLFQDFNESRRRTFRRAIQKLIVVSSDPSFTFEKTGKPSAARSRKKA